MIEVLRAGILTSVQDLGRPGYRHLGIATAGALDTLALEVGTPRSTANPSMRGGAFPCGRDRN